MRRIYLQLPLFLLVVDFIHQAFVCCLVSLCCCNKTKIHPRTNDHSDSYSVSDSVSDSGTCNSPCSYRQPDGKGQFLSRRYCTHSVWLFSCLVKKEQKTKKFFRHISLLARREYDTKARSHALTRAMRKKKRRRFAAGTRTLVDRGHYFHLKAGHDNHLHHSEPIRKWYDASFLACVTLLSRY